MKEIPLTQGKVAKVSDHRYEWAMQWKWRAFFNGYKWYAVRSVKPLRKTYYMHREIMGITNPEIEVDHLDNDGLNNQDENLRICTSSENKFNRGKQSNNHSGYKGVDWRAIRRKYRARIKANGQYIFLGYFSIAEEAARAYDVAAKKYHGSFAQLNFPDELQR